jgi:hypothetical protein
MRSSCPSDAALMAASMASLPWGDASVAARGGDRDGEARRRPRSAGAAASARVPMDEQLRTPVVESTERASHMPSAPREAGPHRPRRR